MDGLPGTEATSVIVTVAVSRAAVSPWGMAVSTVTWSGRGAPKEKLTPSPPSLDSLSTIAVNERHPARFALRERDGAAGRQNVVR